MRSLRLLAIMSIRGPRELLVPREKIEVERIWISALSWILLGVEIWKFDFSVLIAGVGSGRGALRRVIGLKLGGGPFRRVAYCE